MKRVLLSVVAIGVASTLADASSATIIKSKVPVLKFSGKHYLGFVSGDDTNKFETRRNYLQVKAYFDDDPKSYFRMTLDTHDTQDGETNVRLKYAYLYLNNILPNTGVELGQVHRPWIDNEEHGGWNYRSISKVFVEAHDGAHLTNSADRGINFKTKLENFSSELGVFNGEGYHNKEDGEGLSGEWRLTYHALGGGTHKAHKKDNYANISFLGQLNSKSNKHKNQDLNWMGVHAVYNQPEFLLAAQYIKTDDADVKYAGEGFSLNGEYRVAPKWNLIGRYDYFEMDKDSLEKKRTIAAIAYKYNKYVEFIANTLTEDVGGDDETSFMLSAEINW
jgi:hypothetical protein